MGALNGATPEARHCPEFLPDPHGREMMLLPDTVSPEGGAGGEVVLDSPQRNLLALASGITRILDEESVNAGASPASYELTVSYLWGIAGEVLRDHFKRPKYPDVILPMCVIRRLDAILEPTHRAVVETKESLNKAGMVEQTAGLCQASGHDFYNTSKFTLRGLPLRGSQRQLRREFETYLDGFAPNVQDILNHFKFRKQIATLSRADVLGTLIDKFLDPNMNLSPAAMLNGDGSIRQPGLDDTSMGNVFDELVRRFNEENIAESGEHWTPGDAAKLMAKLALLPISDSFQAGSYDFYDGACGTGGVLIAAEQMLRDQAAKRNRKVATHVYGQETDPRTYAICKARMLLRGGEEHAGHIAGGVEHSTLSLDSFPGQKFDFMLSNLPLGKSWRKDIEIMGGKEGIRDPRFKIVHGDDPGYSLITSANDGQMLFLANMASKMNHTTPLGSRIVAVHNDSSLLAGDAGKGESNIRRWIIENDWLEAIIALPSNVFYDNGVATYLWVLSNRKAEPRRGKVQLIDAAQWSRPLATGMGEKKCELADEDIHRICDVFIGFEPSTQSRILPNEAFGYWEITVVRPLRLHSQLTRKAIESLRFASGDEAIRRKLFEEFGDRLLTGLVSISAAVESRVMEFGNGDADAMPEKRRKKLLDPATWKRDHRLFETASALHRELGDGLFQDHNVFRQRVESTLNRLGKKVATAELKLILRAVSWRQEGAPPVIAKFHKPGKAESNLLHGLYQQQVGGIPCVVEYEPDSELSDTRRVPLLEPGGLEAFFRRDIAAHAPDAWIDPSSTKVGYEIPFSQSLCPTKVAAATAPSWKQWEGEIAGGEFPLEQFLAASENGAVFRTRLASGVAAIKLVPAGMVQAKELVERWHRASLLEHPHLIKILQTGTWINAGMSLAYVVMEYGDENLETTLMERALTTGETLEMLQPVAEVLAFLHTRGLVHGHLRPSNIFAVKDTLKISSDGVFVGNPSADVRALAATMVEALTQQAVTLTGGGAEAARIDSLPKTIREIVRNCAGQNGRDPWSAAKLLDSLQLLQPATPQVTASATTARPMRVYRYKRKTPRLTYYAIVFALISVAVVTAGGILRHRAAELAATGSPSMPVVKEEPVAAKVVKSPGPLRESRAQRLIDAQEQVTRKVFPDIPSAAQSTIRGKTTILVKVAVDPSGAVTDAALEHSGGSRYFGNLALQAARKWRFVAVNSPDPREWHLRFEITRTDTKIFPQ